MGKRVGFTAADLRGSGFDLKELKAARFTAADLKAAGFTASELRGVGIELKMLKATGFTAADLRTAEFPSLGGPAKLPTGSEGETAMMSLTSSFRVERKARDGVLYSHDEFLAHYGACRG